MPKPPMLMLFTGPPGTGKSTLAAHAAAALHASVLGWDWVMAGLTPFATIQKTLSVLDPVDHRKVGWSIMRNLAVAQLRDGRSVVLDGVARDDEIATTRGTADLVLDAMNDLDANRRALVQLIGTREASELR